MNIWKEGISIEQAMRMKNFMLLYRELCIKYKVRITCDAGDDEIFPYPDEALRDPTNIDRFTSDALNHIQKALEVTP